MQSMSAESIGVKGISVTGDDSTNADAAVDTIGRANKESIFTAFSSWCRSEQT